MEQNPVRRSVGGDALLLTPTPELDPLRPHHREENPGPGHGFIEHLAEILSGRDGIHIHEEMFRAKVGAELLVKTVHVADDEHVVATVTEEALEIRFAHEKGLYRNGESCKGGRSLDSSGIRWQEFMFVLMNPFRLLLILVAVLSIPAASALKPGPNLEPENLVAWCIVPFDAKQRGPAERAAMLKDLGISRSAYDWRNQHIPEFEEEILEYQKHGIEFFAFWGGHEAAFALFEKYDLHPQIWRTAGSPSEGTQEEKVEAAANAMEALAKRTGEIGCQLGLYNHGGWGGEPANLVAVCQRLREKGHDHVGIVYNWHHGHDHIADWAEVLTLMQPYLLCLNLNGMNDGANPKILSLAQGQHERVMLETVLKSGYAGPIGILDHQNQLDSKEALQDNLDGLAWLKAELEEPGSGGVKPVPKAKPIVAP